MHWDRKDDKIIFSESNLIVFTLFPLGHAGRRAFGDGRRKENANWAENVPGTRNQKAGKSCSRPHFEQKQEQSTETCLWIQEQSCHVMCWPALRQSAVVKLISPKSLSRVEKWWWFGLPGAGIHTVNGKKQLIAHHGILNWLFPLSHFYFLYS